MIQEKIDALLGQQKEMYSMSRELYRDRDIYEREIDRIFLKSWLYAGHRSEIPGPGDWFLFEFGEESVIIVHGGDGNIRALLNVCRHRGSRVCIEHKGCSRNLRCRYHGWTYDLDGQLMSAAHMDESFDKSEIGLKSIHVEVLDGMIFVNFADEPASFEPVREGLSEVLAPYQLDSAKVAHRQSYPIRANWKLAVENYCECYHCAPSHPEYSKGHSLARPDARTADINAAVMERAAACGLSDKRINFIYQESPGYGEDYSYDR